MCISLSVFHTGMFIHYFFPPKQLKLSHNQRWKHNGPVMWQMLMSMRSLPKLHTLSLLEERTKKIRIWRHSTLWRHSSTGLKWNWSEFRRLSDNWASGKERWVDLMCIICLFHLLVIVLYRKPWDSTETKSVLTESRQKQRCYGDEFGRILCAKREENSVQRGIENGL